jgi:hypothetical protein
MPDRISFDRASLFNTTMFFVYQFDKDGCHGRLHLIVTSSSADEAG